MQPKYKPVAVPRSNRLIILGLLDQLNPYPHSRISFGLNSIEVYKSFSGHANTVKQLINKNNEKLYFYALPEHNSRYKVPVSIFRKTGKLMPNAPITRSFHKATFQSRGTKLKRISIGQPVTILAVVDSKAKPHQFKRSFYDNKSSGPLRPVFVVKGLLGRKGEINRYNRRK